MISIILSILALIAATGVGVATLLSQRRSIEVSTYQRATELFLKLTDMFLTYPELRPYFYDRKTLDSAADDVERSRALMAAELHLDAFDWIGHECEGASMVDQDSWLGFMRSMFESSIILWESHEAHPEWHPVLDTLLFGDKLSSPGRPKATSVHLSENTL